MSTLLHRTQRAMFIIVAGFLTFSFFSPMVTLADTNLAAGEQAFISSGGSDLVVRTEASYDAEVVTSVPDGTSIYIVDVAVYDASGEAWYQIDVSGQSGFIPAWAASGAGSGEETAVDETVVEDEAVDDQADEPVETATEEVVEEEPTTSTIPWTDPIDYGVVVDNADEPLPGDGLACRAAATTDAEVIARFGIGETVEITGEKTWAGDIAFYPVNCVGQGGFARASYVSVEDEEQIAETPVTEEPATEAPTEATAEEAETEEPAGETPEPTEAADTTGDLIVTAIDTNGVAIPDACFALLADDETVASSCDADDAFPGNGNSGFFGIEAGSYQLVFLGADGTTSDVTIEAGDEAAITVTISTGSEEPVDETPVTTEAPVSETPATTEQPMTETPEATEATATEEPGATEESSVETPEATEIAATEEPAVETPVATEVPATEETATETPATEEAEATEAPVAEAPVVGTAEATEVPATEEPADDDNVVKTTPVVGQTPTPVAVGTPLPADDTAIGSAVVQGTNGEGVRCRVSPKTDSSVIAVLPEGTNVTVYAQEGSYLAINCGSQLGYASNQFLWSGGAGEDVDSSVATVKVMGTGGGGLNCRADASRSGSIITLVSEGAVLGTRGASSNGWLPVVCGGQQGFVSLDYVEASTGGEETPELSAAAAGSATVSGTGGDGVRCRSAANTSGSIITVVSEGTKVGTRGAASGGWTPVTCGGKNGYISSQYLTASSGGSSNGGGTSSGNVQITGTGGGGLRCRSGAGTSAGIITVLAEGSTVAVRGAAKDGWQPVTCAGQNGYVSTEFIKKASGGGTPSQPSTPSTGNATVSGTGGDGVRCRSAANTSGSIITVVPEGTKVGVRGTASGGWTPVTCGGKSGYISSQYLKASSGSTPTTPSNPGTTGKLAINDHARVTSTLNLRYNPSTTAGIASVVPGGDVVLITGGLDNGFYKVSWGGNREVRGYMHGDYLTKTSAPLTQRGGSGNPGTTPTPTPDPGGGGATGNALVDYAMRYLGYPYVSATHGPASFDCSGFTYWVAKNVLGIDIGYGTWSQTVAGTPVSKANLQPGDLVFFQNTYKAGLSHVGIYIGGGQFIHAETESTGVRISDLNSSYYGSRWFGATRLT